MAWRGGGSHQACRGPRGRAWAGCRPRMAQDGPNTFTISQMLRPMEGGWTDGWLSVHMRALPVHQAAAGRRPSGIGWHYEVHFFLTGSGDWWSRRQRLLCPEAVRETTSKQLGDLGESRPRQRSVKRHQRVKRHLRRIGELCQRQKSPRRAAPPPSFPSGHRAIGSAAWGGAARRIQPFGMRPRS